MTSKQRKIHLLLWLILGPAALLGLVLAVAWRPVQPVQDGALPGVSDEIQQVETRGNPGGRP